MGRNLHNGKLENLIFEKNCPFGHVDSKNKAYLLVTEQLFRNTGRDNRFFLIFQKLRYFSGQF